MKRLLVAMLVATISASAQQSPETFSLSLQQAIAHALEHNRTAINASRDIEAARQKKWETTAAGLPQVNASVDYNNYLKQQVSVADLNDDGISEEFIFGAPQSATAQATLSQLLFDGSYLVALKASKTYLKYYENAKRKTDNQVREMVIEAYGSALLAQESIAVLERNKTILDKTVFDTNETFKSGLIEEESVEQLQITQASVNSTLNNSRRTRDIAYNMLKLTLGIDLEDQLTLTDGLEALTRAQMVASFGDGFNVSNNIDYQIGQNLTEQRRLELQREKSRALPTLSAFLNYGTTAYSETFTFMDGNQRWYDSSLLGVSLNVPIFSSFARRAKTAQARIALEQSQTLLSETEQRLRLQYENTRSRFEFAVEEFATAKNSLALAERIERKQQIKFTEGLSSSFDFSEAQRQLYTAQQQYLQSMVNVINLRAELENITNAN